MRFRAFLIPCLWLAHSVFCQPTALAESPPEWNEFDHPATGKAESLGGYSAGCVLGAVPLALQGPAHRIMKPERKRHFGHPHLVAFIEKLARDAKGLGLAPLAVGDLAQPRGGPAPNGHASHQSGLDVDLWFSPGNKGGHQQSVVDLPTNTKSQHWSSRVPKLLKLASEAPAVARVFVNPIIKKQLCEASSSDRAWLRKLRPWYGHHEHFHVRLQCPADSASCVNQSPIPAGDGCSELSWWLDSQHQKDRQKGGKKYSKRVGAKPSLPAGCKKVRTAAANRSSDSVQ